MSSTPRAASGWDDGFGWRVKGDGQNPMMPGRLAGKVCIVTGAAGGIGRGGAERFAARGRADRRRSISASPLGNAPWNGPDVVAVPVDLADRARTDARDATRRSRRSVRRTCSSPRRRSRAAPATSSTSPMPTGTDMSTVNLTGTFRVCRAAAPGDGRRPARVAASSPSARSTASCPSRTPRNMSRSKGGVAMLTRAMAVDLARYGILVNMIAPGPIDVPNNGDMYRRAEACGSARRRGGARRCRACPRTAPERRCSLPRTRAATSPAPRSPSTAASRR